jgi:hypothetical protein
MASYRGIRYSGFRYSGYRDSELTQSAHAGTEVGGKDRERRRVRGSYAAELLPCVAVAAHGYLRFGAH